MVGDPGTTSSGSGKGRFNGRRPDSGGRDPGTYSSPGTGVRTVYPYVGCQPETRCSHSDHIYDGTDSEVTSGNRVFRIGPLDRVDVWVEGGYLSWGQDKEDGTWDR